MKIRGLFWKIFLAFWAASVLVVVATSYVIYSGLESHNLKARHQEFVEGLALTIVNHYETDSGRLNKRDFNALIKDAPMFHEMIWRRQFRILDSEGTLVFRNRFRRHGPQHELLAFTILSDSGARYLVESFINEPPKFLLKNLQRINFIQFFFVLIAAAAVSLLLSWSFAKPLRKLGAYSRRYAKGDTQSKIDDKLLNRFDEIGDLARDLNYMGAEVERTISSQKQLLHDVSHELRAPLARLQALAGLLEQRVAGTNDEVERIHGECLRIDALIQQILNLSRAEKIAAEKNEIDMVAFIEEQVSSMAIEYPTRKIEFFTEVDKLRVAVNEYAIDAAFHNVLANAAKYSPNDSVIEIYLRKQGQNLAVVVRDHGSGVDQAELEHLLTPFYRAGNQMHSEGFGLGLSIAQRALRANGGDIRLRNHPDAGFEVTLFLPLSLSLHTAIEDRRDADHPDH